MCAVVPPIAADGACLSVRRFRDRSRPLESFGDDEVTTLIAELVDARCNVVVGGATSAGKTSLLNAALGRVPPGARIVTIEDTAELLPATDHLLRLEARPAAVDGPPAITLEQLVRTALRLRPDRLVVGEVRGPEVLALVQALNTGHDGSWSTCHANSALDVLHRLETLIVQAAPAWPLAAVRQQLTRSIDVVVQVARGVDGGRRVVEVGEVVVSGERLALVPLLDGGSVAGALDAESDVNLPVCRADSGRRRCARRQAVPAGDGRRMRVARRSITVAARVASMAATPAPVRPTSTSRVVPAGRPRRHAPAAR